MIDATLSKNMITILKGFKFSKFISYECGKIFDSAYGNLRINTDKGSIEITNFQRTMPFFNTEEEVTCFECKKVDASTEFKPYCEEPFAIYNVEKEITSIEILNDYININDNEYVISFDQAIIFRIENDVIMFSRDAWFSENITISDNDDYNKIFPVDAAIELWSDEGDNQVRIDRTIKKL